MKFTAVLALAAGVSASYNASIAYTTDVVTALTTYCPEATTLTHNGQTYTVTSATTLTITNCPCTVTKPVTTSSVVVCNTCGYKNSTAVVPPPATSPYKTPVGTVSATYPASTPSKTVVTAGAGAVGISGAALAVMLGAAALL